MITIDKNIPAPASKVGRPNKYPFRSMDVNDSFFVDELYAKTARNMAWKYAKKNNVKFTTRTEEKGLRIWRIA